MKIIYNTTLLLLIVYSCLGQTDNCSKVYGQITSACLGGEVTLKANTSKSNENASFTWVTPKGKVFNSKELLLTQLKAEDDGVYKVIAKFADGCKNTDSSYINLNIIKEVFYSLSSTFPFCEGNNVELPYISSRPGIDLSKNQITYNWTGPNNYSSTNPTPTILNFTKAKSGYYTLEVQVTGSCNLKSKQRIYLEPTEKMEVGITDNLTNKCFGDKVLIEAKTLNYFNTNNSFVWQGPNNFTSNKSFIEIDNFNEKNVGTYSVTVKTAGCQESAIAQKDIRIKKAKNPLNITKYLGNQFCKGSNFMIGAIQQPTDIFGEITWKGPNNFTAKGSSISIFDFDSKKEGTYYVSVNVNRCSEKFIDSISIALIKTPKLYSINTDSVLFCENSITMFPPYTLPNYNPNSQVGATLPDGKITYEWSGPNGFKSNNESFTIANFNKTNEGEYKVTMTYSNGCEGVLTKKYFLKQRSLSLKWSVDRLCNGNIFFSPLLQLGSVNTFHSYKIYDENLKEVTNPIPKESTGIYTIESTFTGQCNSRDIQKIDVKEATPFKLILPNTIESCVRSSVSILPSFNERHSGGFGDGIYSIYNLSNGSTRLYLSWESPNGSDLKNLGEISNITKSDEGVYKVTGKLVGECTGTFFAETKLIVDEQKPTVAFNYEFENDLLVLKNETKGRVTDYFWNIDNYYQSSLVNPLPITLKSDKPYKITLEASNGCGISSIAKDLNLKILGTEIENKISKLEIFPNPAHEEVFIKNNLREDIKIVVLSSDGKQLKTITSKSNESIKLDLRGFNTGIYYFKYIDENNILHTNKVFIMK
ncbi:T9SS type A sorting domain-containing protein [Emticicia oligotrophica]|uniref:T9SS type A sorting domain-containing protein n=1 Tax=Emticicia oligotrophica TaxID=312279 RepID=UPI00273A7FD1|nr:T9SS type A sorting domain-containing protein [Emticicia oligotrophica]